MVITGWLGQVHRSHCENYSNAQTIGVALVECPCVKSPTHMGALQYSQGWTNCTGASEATKHPVYSALWEKSK